MIHETCRLLWIHTFYLSKKKKRLKCAYFNLNVAESKQNRLPAWKFPTHGELSHVTVCNSHPLPHLTPPFPSPSPSWNESILIQLSLCVLPLAEYISKSAALEMSVQTSMRAWAVMSAATCSFPSVLLSSARLQAVSLILSAAWVQDLGTFYRDHKGTGRRWRQCGLILSKLQGWPRDRDTDSQQTTVRYSAGSIPGTG